MPRARSIRSTSVPTASPTTVLFVRHGTTPTTGKVLPGRAPGLHLSAKGKAQADGVSAAIAAMEPKPVAVYSSPLERTKETAAPIARALGLRVRTERGLLDLDVGDWTGMSIKRAVRRREWAAVQRWPAGFSFPGGESFADLVARASDTVAQLVRAHPGRSIVVVTHADLIRVLVATAAGVPLDLFQRLVVSTCSVSAIRYSPEGPRVLCVNASAEGLVRV